MLIYGLYSTDDGVIKYIGKTKYMLSKRLREHINGALKRNCKTHKDNWIRNVYSNGYKIVIELIEKCDDSIWEEREKYWIKKYSNLTNLTDGGECGHGLLYNISYDETKKYIKTFFPHITSKNEFYKHLDEIDSKYPRNPREAYTIRGEWVSWGDFLGTNRIQDNKKTEKYLRFNDAKRYINKYIKAKTSVEYKKYIKEKHIDFLPNKPFRFYKDKGWNGWEDYLSIKKKYQITNDLIARYLKRFFPNVTGNYTFRKNKLKIHRSIHLGIIKNFDFKLLKN